MTDRRTFVASMGALGIRPTTQKIRAPRVEASPSVFHAHPAAERTLVRFRAYDIDAPAGRMRIIGRRGELLGTAGVIRRENHLYGESLLLTENLTNFTTQLEAPGLSRPLRNNHRLTPKPEWTIYWVTVADPFEMDSMLRRLNPANLAVALAIIHRSSVLANPLAINSSWASADHMDAFRSSLGARELERRWNIPASPVAIADRRLFDLSAAPLILAGNGIQFAFTPGVGSSVPFEAVESRDGSRVTLAETAGGSDAQALGFAANRDVMAASVERWLESGPTLVAPEFLPNTAVVLSTAIEDERATMLARVDEWNGRFAYPRIVMGGIDEITGQTQNIRPRVEADRATPLTVPPSAEQLQAATAERRIALETRVDSIIDPLRQLVGGDVHGVKGWIQKARFSFPGHVVFNPSPFPRSDYVTFPNGHEELATNVPAAGYAYTPALPGTEPPPSIVETGVLELSGQRFRLRLDPVTGAIASMYQADADREWCSADGGLNHVDGARIEEVTRTTIPGGATRLDYSRRSNVGRINTTITVYADNQWIDVVNRTESERIPVDYQFHFADESDSVSWETPGGFERREAPFGGRAHLRWIAVEGPEGKGLLRCLDTPYFRTETPPGATRIVSLTTGGTNRYRLDAVGQFGSPDAPWQFGWDAEPFIALETDPSGTETVPTFGRVLRTDSLTILAGLRMADEGFAIIAYLQNSMNVPRLASIESALVRFEAASVVDFVERDLGEALEVSEGRTEIELPAHGVRAVRLSGISLNEG